MLEGIVRDSMHRLATKQMRKDGYLIANIYGKGLENISAAFKRNEFIKALRAKENIVFEVSVAGTVYKVVVKEYQKHPMTSDLLHVDLMVAQPGVRTNYSVPVTTSGTPIGLKNKGLFIVHKKRIPVKCTVENLPEVFNLEVSALDNGHSILVRDMKMPANVDCYLDPRVPVVGVINAK